jgi:methyl-accepting chemotaxis protein
MVDRESRLVNYGELSAGLQQAAAGRKIYEPLPQTPEEARLWNSFIPRWEEWQRGVQTVVNMEREKDSLLAAGAKSDDPRLVKIDDVTLLDTNRLRESRAESIMLLEQLVRLNNEYASVAVQQSETLTAKNMTLMIFMMLFCGATAATLGFFIARSINRTLTALRDESARLTESAVAGQLSTRADVMSVPAEFRSIIQGVNDTLDAVINPLNVAADYVDKISKGSIPSLIVDNYNGNFNTVKNNLNGLISNLSLLIDDMAQMSKQHDAGAIDFKMPEEKFQGVYGAMAKGVNDMVFGHIAVNDKAMACIAEFGRGNFDAELEKFPGKKASINDNVERMRSNVKAFIQGMIHMSKEHDAGDIDVRVFEDKFEGAYRVMAKGVNDMVFGHIAVKKKAMACLAEFAAGNFNAPLEKFPGKKAFINDNIELLRSNSKALVEDVNLLAKAAVEGSLATRADATKHQGDYRKIVQGFNDTLDSVIGPLNVAADYVDKISKGNIPPKITDTYSGDFNTIKSNLNQCIDAINRMIADAGVLAQAAIEGKLSTRAQAAQHAGAFREIIQGVNDTLDAVIGPLNVAADYVDKISKGNIPPKIMAAHTGDFNAIKNNLNRCIDAVNMMAGDASMLTQAAVDGKLSTRADPTKHEGDFRRIIQGVNDTLDAVIGPLNVAADYIDKISKGNIPPEITISYNGDFNTLKNNINCCVTAVNSLVADADLLVQSAIEGKLSTRADVTRHEGDFRKIVDGVNRTLDAVIMPVMETAEALETLARYDLRVRVTGDYQGDHARIKDALNATAGALQDALTQVADSVEQVTEASQQIAGSSQAVSQGASEQASSLEETSSSLEEMAGMTKQNADNTFQARALSQTTKAAAEKGGLAMARMTDAMEKIRAASEGTAEIIKDINDIAFQTNLLALNAAVEAARAGDAGRGFAVVAEEVRNLALRSKEAAKKTEKLIKVAVGHSENGRTITNEVANSLTEIVTAAAKVNDIVGEIAVASQEQSRGIEQVNIAVAEMDKVVQTAASNAEESSSAAEELASQSEELSSLVARFELARDDRRYRRAASASREPEPRVTKTRRSPDSRFPEGDSRNRLARPRRPVLGH